MSDHSRRRRMGVCAALSSVVLSLSSCAGAASSNPASSKSVVWAVSADFDSIDPAKCFDFNCLTVVPNVTESLLRLDPSGTPQPNLATKFTFVTPTKLQLDLRDGVTFQDGNPMTADDVVYSLNRTLDPDVGSYVGYMFDSIKSIKKTGEHQVTLQLSKPDSRLVPALATTAGAVTEKAFVEKYRDRFGAPEVGTMGTGPYKFVSWDKGEKVTLKAYDHYWNADRQPAIKTFTVRVVKDESTIVAGLRSGDIDGAFDSAVSGRTLKALKSADGLTEDTVPGAGVRLLAFNMKKAPFDDQRVREALTLAIDREGLLKSSGGGIGKVIRSLTPPSLYTGDTEVFKAGLATYPDPTPDLERAKKLVAEAGATGASAELWSTGTRSEDALAIQQAAQSIGLKITIKELPAAELTEAQQNTGKGHPYGLTLMYAVADLLEPYGMLGFVYKSDAPFNAMGYDDPRFDSLAGEAVTESNAEKRAKLFVEAEKRLFEAHAVVPLYAPDAVMVHSDKIGGYDMRALWSWDSFAADLRGSGS